MPDEKDRYGDKLRDLERAREDKFFAERDRDLVEKMRTQETSKQAADRRTGVHMRCPKCGEGLAAANHFGVTVEECVNCGGMWLDKGELDELAKRESSGWLARYLGRPR
ncbi:MAG: zf-TFIIB domain-containing protein [Deltaproteobacteria bacterium]|nr:zf-TFIIB domain-containing protein [Deltaproteobacteria bacterium]